MKSLKVKIAITLALLLLAAIGLTNFVLLRIIENNIIESRFESGAKWIIAIYENGRVFEPAGSGLPDYESMSLLGIACVVYNKNGETREISTSDSAPVKQNVRKLADKVKSTRRPEHLFAGREWGIFWKRSKYLVIGVPLPGSSGAGVAALDLGSNYRMLRNAQQVATGYMFLNFLILFAVGAYRLSILITRPIQRFIRLTDSYPYFESFDLFFEKQNDEFSRLSSSLNNMMRRIENDRKELEHSIDEIEKANQDLKKAQQEIVRAEKLASIGRLSAGIAHEIGNPIGIVLGYLGLLKSRFIPPDDSTGIDYIERAEAEINRVNKILRQLLDFSRSASSGFTCFSVHDLLYETGRMLSHQPLMEKIRLYFDFSASNDIVYADYHQMHQVIVNLVLNAADSISMSKNSENGEIRLYTSDFDAGRQIRIEVQDNGFGIPEENMDRVFDPFFTTKETGKGTGLGLYVSYMIIQGFGGNVSTKIDDDEKTTIIIHLPLYLESAPE